MPVQNNSWYLRFVRYWLAVIIYAILMFYLSSVPGRNVPRLFPGQDILFHIVEYGIFAVLINRALREYCPYQSRMRRLFYASFLIIIYAMSDELHQNSVPDRSASLYDVFIDVVGSFIGSLFYIQVKKPIQ